MSSDPREEFYGEAQELIDSLARDLLALETSARGGAEDPELVNDIFRSVHTLKGLAGLFQLSRLATLTHELENRLDDMRTGRLAVSPSVLDVLFKAVELLGRMLASARRGEADDDNELPSLLASLKVLGNAVPPKADDELSAFDLDPDIVRVLTEAEEHRLRTNVKNGTPLYRIRARFPIDRIDKALDELKQRAKPLGEIIAYLPTGDLPADGTLFELDLLYASAAPTEQLRNRLDGQDATIHRILRKNATSHTSVPAASAAAMNAVLPPPAATPREARESVPAGFDKSYGEQPSTNERAALQAPTPAGPKTPVPPRPEEEGSRAALAGRMSHTVRVDIRRLDHLMNVLGELAIVRGSLQRLTERLRLHSVFRDLTAELHRLHRAFDRNLAEMQSGILEVRMVPLGQVFERLARAVRQIARQNDKEIRLVVTGAETEVDKLIVEELSDPLLHIVRNSIDHGIEPQVERTAQGKPVEGTIALNAYQAGNHVIIEIEDDGAGVDHERVVATAVRKGLLTEEQARDITPRDAINFLFLPGFSTRESVTDLSGRGVGLDVVKTNIARLGGVVDVQSERGIGTKFTITLPITLAILRALLLGVSGRTYALPLSSVAEATVLDIRSVRTVEGREVTSLRGETLPLCHLDRLFGHDRAAVKPNARSYVVVVALGGRRVGIVVDELFGQQDIVIKALGPSLAAVRGFAGATDLGDQRVGLVLDAAALLDEVLSSGDRRGTEAFSVGR
jgi:two-component system chemotaxis sensor kinase CheA